MRNKFYAAAWRVLRPLVLFFLPVDLRGTEHLEGGEPVLLCANHSSRWCARARPVRLCRA